MAVDAQQAVDRVRQQQGDVLVRRVEEGREDIRPRPADEPAQQGDVIAEVGELLRRRASICLYGVDPCPVHGGAGHAQAEETIAHHIGGWPTLPQRPRCPSMVGAGA